jgi:thioredoxin 2
MTAGVDRPVARVVVCPKCRAKNRVPASATGKPQCAKCHSPLPWVVDASDDDFAMVADEAAIPVLVDLWAPWCAPCRQVSPVLEQLATEMAGRIKLVKVNSDHSPALSYRFDVQAIPTLVLLDHGETIAKQVGAAPAPRLRAWVNEHLKHS